MAVASTLPVAAGMTLQALQGALQRMAAPPGPDGGARALPATEPTLAAQSAQPALPAQEIRLLLCHALGLTRIQLLTRDQDTIDQAQAERLASLLARRIGGEPVAYLLGAKEFYGLPFAVTPDVLIPRPETELLVDLALDRLPQAGRALDMGTGSGAIAVAIAHFRPDAQVSACDISPAALALARRNALANQAAVRFTESDWFAALEPQRFDLIAANPPYIEAGDPHLAQGDLRFEPVSALTDHADGLSALRRIVAGAPAFLAPGGWLLLEHGYNQAEAVRALLEAQGYGEVQSWADLAAIPRVSGGRMAG